MKSTLFFFPQLQKKSPPSAADKEEAERLKTEGNNLMRTEKFVDALEMYSKAIELDGGNPVFYCNRAAAHSKMNNHHLAIEDCQRAIDMDPSYSKAYGRMGLAHRYYQSCWKNLLLKKQLSSPVPLRSTEKQWKTLRRLLNWNRTMTATSQIFRSRRTRSSQGWRQVEAWEACSQGWEVGFPKF